MKEEIQSSDWAELFARLNDFERGQLVTIRAVGHDGSEEELGAAMALESIEFGPLNGCTDGIRIRAAGGFEHVITEPLHVRLVRNPTGGFNPVEIDAEEGSAVLHFKPALKPPVLEGLTRVGWAGAAK
jgi:hypothetical protein